MRKQALFIMFLLSMFLGGCAVNPVTGDRELALISESQEIELGRKNYAPSRQMQGGDYSVEPALTVYVSEVGQRLAKVSDRQLPYEFVVLNNSVPNAWALPGGKIAVNRGLLLELENEAELAAVLAHEIVHAAARHGAKGVERGILLQGAMVAAGIASRDSGYANIVVGGAQVAAGLVNSKYGRDAELQSDFYGMQYMSRAGYDPMAAVKLQETFVRLSEGKSVNWLAGLFASHPPSTERVETNRRTAKTLPAGGRLGQAPYQNRIAALKRTKPAYQAFDQGQKALADNQIDQALNLAQKALALEPREALFHGLRGDVRLKQKHYKDALTNFDQALQRDNKYFYYFLQRGLVRLELDDRLKAQEDLKASVDLLPTAIAYKGLGNIAESQGRHEQAKEFYKAAAESPSEPGRQALQSLVRLDLPDNPGAYLRARPGLSNDNVIVQVDNQTPVAVAGVHLLVQYLDAGGRRNQLQQMVPGLVPAGGSVRIMIGALPLNKQVNLGQAVQVRVIGAQVAE